MPFPFQMTFGGATPDELKANVAAWLGTTSTKAVLSGAEQARLRSDAVVVPPAGAKDKTETKAPTAAEKKAAEKAAAKKKAEEEAAAKAAEEAAKAETDETDPLDEGSDGDEAEALTHDDVKKLLVEVRGKHPQDATIVSKLVAEHGKAKKLSDVDEALLPAIAAACRKLLA